MSGLRAHTIQLAARGQWERATTLPAQPASLAEAEAWLAALRGGDDGALEVLFGEPDFERLLGVRCAAADLSRLLPAVLRPCSWPEAIAAARRVLGPSLFDASAIAFVELGVFNAWQTFGAARLWTVSEGAPAPDVLVERALASCHGSTVRPQPLLLESGWPAPVAHWIGVQVSERADGGHLLSPSRLRASLTSF